ncbi:MAG: nuclear transport factor 2 family protein [Gemmatimonadales bacterium]
MSKPTAPEAQAIVTRLAHALDADDFSSARAYLDDDCVYAGLDETRRGSEAILASYADASARAHRTFDEVRYASEVAAGAGATVSVTFTDYLLKAGGRWHRYRCRQEFTVGPAGRIVRITHHELPGEREGLDAYFEECGIER